MVGFYECFMLMELGFSLFVFTFTLVEGCTTGLTIFRTLEWLGS